MCQPTLWAVHTEQEGQKAVDPIYGKNHGHTRIFFGDIETRSTMLATNS